jgi:hypothetical protein
MLAETTGELRLAIPMWGSIVLALVGVVYLVLGTWWRRFFDVLSMTVLGCLAGLVVGAWIPLSQPLVITICGLVLGGLTAFFRNVCHAILAAVVLAGVLAYLAGLAVGPHGFANYQVVNSSNPSFSVPVQLSAPNLADDPVLAAGVAGILIGVTVAVARFAFSERLVTSAQGAALIVFGVASLVNALRGEGRPALATAYPLTLSVFWLCLLVIGLVSQSALVRRHAQQEGALGDAAEQEA